MTRDAQESVEEVKILQTQLANALTLPAREALAAAKGQEDRGQKFPTSPDYLGLDCTQFRG